MLRPPKKLLQADRSNHRAGGDRGDIIPQSAAGNSALQFNRHCRIKSAAEAALFIASGMPREEVVTGS